MGGSASTLKKSCLRTTEKKQADTSQATARKEAAHDEPDTKGAGAHPKRQPADIPEGDSNAKKAAKQSHATEREDASPSDGKRKKQASPEKASKRCRSTTPL